MARRSARLSKSNQSPQPSGGPSVNQPSQLGSVLEREESEDEDVFVPQSIDHVVNDTTNAAIQQQLQKLSSLKTPKTEPRPTRAEMHPKTVHQTMKSPDSGTKLGFSDLPSKPRTSVASVQNSPSRAHSQSEHVQRHAASKFTFGIESQLSQEAQRMMESIREEAALIKAQMLAAKEEQDHKDAEAEKCFSGINATRRKIANPKSKAGRFSDVHMAQFKKMDSIANHPSSFRARPGFALPTTQSLKRSGSKAGLDDFDDHPERPRTAGKGIPKQAPPFMARPASASLFKSNVTQQSEPTENPSPAKRQRLLESGDLSSSHTTQQMAKPSGMTKPTSSTLFSPTKSFIAKTLTTSPSKPSLIPRSQSSKSLRGSNKPSRPSSTAVTNFTSKLIQAQHEARTQSLTSPVEKATPGLFPIARTDSKPGASFAATPKPSLSSRLPTFAGLKSILRSTRKASQPTLERAGTPKRPNTSAGIVESAKKVDFTPSVKSRYAVKLANDSPAPAGREQDASGAASTRAIPYDPAAFVVDDDEETWEDASNATDEEAGGQVEYPSLPPPSATFSNGERHVASNQNEMAPKERDRKEVAEFKSIFTTLHHPSRPNSQNSNPPENASACRSQSAVGIPAIAAPKLNGPRVLKQPTRTSTIRRVRASDSTEMVRPFEDTAIQTMEHGLPGKKRRRQSQAFKAATDVSDDAKATRRSSNMPAVPGGWRDSPQLQNDADERIKRDGYESDDEGVKRGAKRARVLQFKDIEAKENNEPLLRSPVNDLPTRQSMSPMKKPSAAREEAKRNAARRKSMMPAPSGTGANVGAKKGVLSLSRLNVLSQPKNR